MEQTGLMTEQAQTRWLSEPEQQAWRAFLNACRRLFPEMDAHLQHVAGIPHAYYEILVRLSEAPGRELRMTQLADASTSSKSRLSHAVARLEARGWIERLACPTDRRGQIARLTDAGFAALDAAAHQHVDQVRRMVFDQLTPAQVEQLAAISAAIEAGVEEVSSSPAAEACRAEAEARDGQAAAGAGPREPLEADGDSCPL
ncbi:MAG TPA: MarR family transcriptional regulator [Streptosporangiaceae bacterium]|jgi:DNA-binding MarR family transcriptional regulator